MSNINHDKWQLRNDWKYHEGEWKWGKTHPYMCHKVEWWKVWVVLGFRDNPFEKIPDYAISCRKSKWHETLRCKLMGHDWTPWEACIGWTFDRKCRTCRTRQLERGENLYPASRNW